MGGWVGQGGESGWVGGWEDVPGSTHWETEARGSSSTGLSSRVMTRVLSSKTRSPAGRGWVGG